MGLGPCELGRDRLCELCRGPPCVFHVVAGLEPLGCDCHRRGWPWAAGGMSTIVVGCPRDAGVTMDSVRGLAVGRRSMS